MTGQQLLIAAIVIVLVIAFIITVVLQNVTAKEIISTNTKLVENQNALLEQNINEKRFLEGCRLLREESNWTIEAVGAAAGFGGRRTFQTEVKRRLGITPVQYRQANVKVKDEK